MKMETKQIQLEEFYTYLVKKGMAEEGYNKTRVVTKFLKNREIKEE